jgi:cysteinyl-tRNA synthetase
VFGLESLAVDADAPAEIVELAKRRQAAREARDFGEADRLRAELEAAGWEARDAADGYRLVPIR